MRYWADISPADAAELSLPAIGIIAPRTSDGMICPWPWEPEQLKGQPIGQYHCPYCGDMVVAGIKHPDYAAEVVGREESPVQRIVRSMVDLAGCALEFGRIERTAVYHPGGTRKETDADHTVMLGWMACSVAFIVAPMLDVGKVAQLALAHDAVEVYAGDTPTLRITAEERQAKHARERDAMALLSERFGLSLPWLPGMVQVYESRLEPEARFVWALDKLMPKLVHLQDDLHGLKEHGVTQVEFEQMFKTQRKALDGVIAADPWAVGFMGLYFDVVDRVLNHPGWAS
jgi:5'-deoxynucleotidase YfbR-like HD superfamily hydrolase